MIQDSYIPSPRCRAPLPKGEVKFVATKENIVFLPLLWGEVEQSEGEGEFGLIEACQ